MPNRGDIYWAYLDPTVGTEQKGRRPVVVVSPDEINANLKRVIVLPITKQRRDYPTFIEVKLGGEICYAMLDQIRTLDTNRLKGKIGSTSTAEFREIMRMLQTLFS